MQSLPAGQVDEAQAKLWLDPLQPYSEDLTAWVLYAPNAYISEHVRGAYLPLLVRALKQSTGRTALDMDVKVGIVSTPDRPTRGSDTKTGQRLGPDPTLSFENFISAPVNTHAVALAKAMITSPAQIGSLYIHGPSGAGKTHLLQALVNAWATARPDQSVVLLRPQDRLDSPQPGGGTLLDRADRAHLVVLDEALFLPWAKVAGAPALPDWLCDTARPLVVASKHSPRGLLGLNMPLSLRLEKGRTAALGKPDEALSMAIAQGLTDADSWPAPLLSYLNDRYQRHPGKIKQAMARIRAMARLSKQTPSLQLAIKALYGEHRPNGRAREVTDIQHLVSDVFGLGVEQLLSRSRTQRIVLPRSLYLSLACEALHTHSREEIGARSGSRSRKSVTDALARAARARRDDPALAGLYEGMLALLQ